MRSTPPAPFSASRGSESNYLDLRSRQLILGVGHTICLPRYIALTKVRQRPLVTISVGHTAENKPRLGEPPHQAKITKAHHSKRVPSGQPLASSSWGCSLRFGPKKYPNMLPRPSLRATIPRAYPPCRAVLETSRPRRTARTIPSATTYRVKELTRGTRHPLGKTALAPRNTDHPFLLAL